MKLLSQTGQIGDSISISGNNLSRISSVEFSGNATGKYNLVNINTLSVEIPKNTQSGKLTVISTERNITGYTENDFYPQPIIQDFTPSTGISGESFSLTGESLGSATGVEINNLSCEFTVASNSGLSITVPSGNTFGFVKVYSQMPTGTSGEISNTSLDKFHPDIRISGFSVPSGRSGDAIGISGTYFFDELMSGFKHTDNQYEVKYESYSITGTGVAAGEVDRKFLISKSGLNDYGKNKIITLYRNHKYYFNQGDESNLGHGFRIGRIPDGPWGDITSGWYSGEYTSGVSFSGSPGSGSGAYTTFEVPSDAPDKLFYYDNFFTGVGGTGYFEVLEPSGYLVSFEPSGATGWFYKTSNTLLTGLVPDYAISGQVKIGKHESIE